MIMKPSRIEFGMLNRYHEVQAGAGAEDQVMRIIRELENEGGSGGIVEILERAEANGIDRATTTRRINNLENMGMIFVPRPGIIRSIENEQRVV